MNKLRIVLLAAALAVLGGALVLTQSGQDLFQQALVKEQADGDLRAAIALYQRIVRDFQGDRALTAKALVQMGRCHERLGQAEASEARKAYERVVREFGDQKDVAAEARTRLAALAGPAGATGSPTMTVRLVGQFMANAISPDGRYAAIQDAKGLVIRDLRNGQTRVFKPIEKGARYYPWSAFSPDGSQIAYRRYPEDIESQPEELLVSGIDGSSPRVLVSTEPKSDRDYFEAYGWSPDGKAVLLGVRTKNDRFEIRLAMVHDGTSRLVGTLDARQPFAWPDHVCVSPDGHYLAYDYPPRQGTREPDIFLLPIEGGAPVPLVEHPARDTMFGWAPDGTQLLFLSDRSGTWDAWLLPVQAGRPQGPPALARREMASEGARIRPVGFTKDGSFYYRLPTMEEELFVATVDLDRGTVVVPPATPVRRFVGGSESDWSPDGRQLAYTRPLRSASPKPIVAIRSVETGEEREVSPTLRMLGLSLRWSPDGRFLLAAPAVDAEMGLGTYVFNLQGEVTARLRANAGDWCCDGKAVVTGRNREKWDSLFVRNLETGQYQEIYSGPVGSFIAVSRDGRSVAFSALDLKTPAGPGKPSATLKIVPVAGGQPRELLKLEYPRAFGSIAWTPDGRRLLFVQNDQEDRTTGLWSIPVEGGKAQSIGLAMSPGSQISVHPDGRRIAYNVSKNRQETWVIQNLLRPAERRAP